MKKTILLILGGFVIGALISPVAGMAINSTRSLILGMAPEEAILALADKIDEEAGRNDAQEQAIEDLNNTNQQQGEALNNLAKEQEVASCNERRTSCESKTNAIGSKEIVLSPKNNNIPRTSRQDMIKQIEGRVSECKKTRDSGEFSSDAIKNAWESCIKDGEKDIATIKSAIASESAEKVSLLNGECKDYQNPCE